MIWTNSGAPNVINNPLIYSVYCQSIHAGHSIPPAGGIFLVTDSGIYIVTDSGLYITTDQT